MNTKHHTTSRVASTITCGAVALLLASGLAACRGERSDKPPVQFLPDMDDSPKFKPQSQAPFFEDGRAMRRPVAGTVAFGYTMNAASPSRSWSAADDPAVFEGLDPSRPAVDGRPAYQAVIPNAVFDRMLADAAADGKSMTRAELVDHMLDRGQERFNIYCSACHGYQGEGGGGLADNTPYGGVVGQRWTAPIPTYHDPKYKDRAVYTGADGYLFSVIRHGVPNADPGAPPKMPSYADKINVPDAWAVVLYVRALQASWRENLEGLPAEMRERLEDTRPASSRSAVDQPSAGSATASTETNP
jgi:mono/diheme cytochrome c family protein